MSIRLVSLGGLRGTVNGAELDWLASRTHVTAVLVFLALQRSATRDALMAMFWPESEADVAGHRLSQTIYWLRQSLGEDCIETKGRDVRIGASVWIDAVAFDASLAAGHLEEAAALYAGPFLRDVHLVASNPFELWVDQQRSRLARDFRKVGRETTAVRERAGDLEGALAAARGWTHPDPTDDEAQHKLIELLSRVGDRSGALRQYDDYVALLAHEELQPLDETKALVAALTRQSSSSRLQGAAPDAVISTAPAAISPSSPGLSRVRSRWWLAGLVCTLVGVGLTLRPRPEQTLEVPRIAVLPLHADDATPDLRPLATGLTVELHGALGDVTGLEVASLNASLPFRDTPMPMDSLGARLDARWLIGGTVTRVGPEVRVSIEVLEAAANRTIATHRLAGRIGQELALIDAVVASANVMLRELLGREVRLDRWRLGTSEATAFEAMSRAWQDMSDADQLIPRSDISGALDRLRSADQALAQASAEDPDWAEPWIERARVARRIAFIRYGTPSLRLVDSISAVLARGIAHADEARQRADNAGRALEARGELRYAQWLMVSPLDSTLRVIAAADLDSARTVDATLARAPYVRGALHYFSGEFERARLLTRQAFDRDALLDGGRELLTRLFTYNFEDGADAEARRWCLAFARGYGDEWFTSHCQLQLMVWDSSTPPQIDSAWAIAQRGAAGSPDELRAMQGSQLTVLVAGVVARAGLRDSARRVLARARSALSPNPRAPQPAIDLLEAGVRGMMGDVDEAVALRARYLAMSPISTHIAKRSRRLRLLPPYQQ